MKTLKFNNQEEWLQARIGKITGSRLKEIVVKRGTKPKKGFYELIAERVALPSDGENPMDRGHRLEPEAVARFVKETGKEVDTELYMWIHYQNENIALSPDGVIHAKNSDIIEEAVEVKCLNAASHIESWHQNKIPDEYEMQKIQYFIVNEMLQTLYFVMYNPLIPKKDFFYFTVHRKDVESEIVEYEAYQESVLAEVERITNELTF